MQAFSSLVLQSVLQIYLWFQSFALTELLSALRAAAGLIPGVSVPTVAAPGPRSPGDQRMPVRGDDDAAAGLRGQADAAPGAGQGSRVLGLFGLLDAFEVQQVLFLGIRLRYLWVSTRLVPPDPGIILFGCAGLAMPHLFNRNRLEFCYASSVHPKNKFMCLLVSPRSCCAWRLGWRT